MDDLPSDPPVKSEAEQDAVPENSPGAQAHCPHCIEPVSPEQYYCTKCGKPISGLVGLLPYESIPFEINFFSSTWRKMLAAGTFFPIRVIWCARRSLTPLDT